MFVKNDIVFIDNSNTKENFYCSLCKFPFLTFFDFEKSKEYNCCHDCYLQFIEGKKEKWNAGQRPDKTVIKEYIKIRKQLIKRNN